MGSLKNTSVHTVAPPAVMKRCMRLLRRAGSCDEHTCVVSNRADSCDEHACVVWAFSNISPIDCNIWVSPNTNSLYTNICIPTVQWTKAGKPLIYQNTCRTTAGTHYTTRETKCDHLLKDKCLAAQREKIIECSNIGNSQNSNIGIGPFHVYRMKWKRNAWLRLQC